MSGTLPDDAGLFQPAAASTLDMPAGSPSAVVMDVDDDVNDMPVRSPSAVVMDVNDDVNVDVDVDTPGTASSKM